MNADLYGDPSWDTALKVAHKYLAPPSLLVRLVHNSWKGSISLKEFLHALQVASIPPSPFVRAAQLIEPSVNAVETAVEKLGFKGASSIAAVHFACGAIVTKCESERLRTMVLQRIMDSIEIGYHFGLSASAIGPDTGILIGFAQSIGSALLVLSSNASSADAKPLLEGSLSQRECLARFDCEPYQVSSLALQRLGFGPEFASAAVMALGNLNHELVTSNPLVRDWWAASDWISALIAGKERPKRKSSASHFPELLKGIEQTSEIPLHLSMLSENVQNVRSQHSTWTWYVPQQ
jgi:hypothetical protein